MGRYIKRVTLDVLNPQEPGVDKYAEELANLEVIDSIKITLNEIDTKTETVKIIIEGDGIEMESIQDKIKKLGGTIHSIDDVVASTGDLLDTSFYYEE